GNSSDTNLVPNANIVFGGSGSNRTVTITPAANQSGITTITILVTDGEGLSASTAFTLTVGSHAPGVFIWNGPGAGANNWSASGNWSPAGPPESLDDLKFYDPGASGVAVSNVNNFVDATAPATVASLQYANSNGNHTTLLAAGKTLNIVGTLGVTVGTETDNGNTQVVTATITGLAATLNVSGGNLTVRQASDPSSSSQRATLDMSGLGNFTATVSRVLVGTEGTIARPTGTLLLAKTNLLTANGSSPAIAVGGAGGGSGNAGGVSHLLLGWDNAIFADSLSVGRAKQGLSSGVASSLRFNPAFTNANPALGPTFFFRAADGSSRVATWNIADSQSQGGTVNTAGACDFTGGTVDALVDAMIVGRSSTGSGAGNPVGTLTLHAGTIDVTTLQVGVQGSLANSSNNIATGTVTVNGGMLIVNSSLQLGPTAGGGGAAGTRGVLAISGGAARVNSISTGTGTNNAIAVNNGTLALTNAVGPGLNSLALTNSTLQLRVVAGTACILATNLTTGSGGSTIQISSLPTLTVFPTNLALIKYTSLSGAGFNFTLGSLPAGAGCGGYLSNNVANSSVDLIVTNCIVPDAFLTWNGDVSGNWDTATANWKNNVGPGLTYAQGNAVVFNDSASGATNVNLDLTLSPSSVVVSNNAKPFTFGGLGQLSGAMSLTKQGAGTLVLAHGGDNDFTGGMYVSGGTLQIGDGGGGGNLPNGSVVNNATLIFDQSDDATVGAVISGSGAVIQDGPNVLTLSGANTFTGSLTIRDGVVRAGNTAALGAAGTATVVTNTGALDVNGLNLTAEPVTISGAGFEGAGAIVNSGAQQISALRTVTLAGDATIGGTNRWDIRNTGGTASLMTGGQPFKLTKIGPNQISLVAVNPIDAALGDVDIQQGVFAIQTSTAQLGNSSYTLTIRSNATLNLWALSSSPLNKKIVVENGGTIWNESGSSFIVGPVVLTNGTATMNVGGTSLNCTNNVISGTGGLTKIGAGTLSLQGSNTYTGDTLISTGTLALVNLGSISKSAKVTIAGGGTLDVSARSDGRLTLANGQTLLGNGTLNGHLTVSPGATVSPGTSIGALTVTNTVTLQGVTFMELNKSAATNDVIRGAASIVFGGTLSLTNLAGALSNGDAFKLFYASAYSGAFTNFLPPMPGSGLAWNTSTLSSDGTLRVSVAPRPVITGVTLAGTNLVLSCSNGIPNAPFQVLTSTNVALALAQWESAATNVFSPSGLGWVTNSAGDARRFFALRIP
ncbi:MAG: hypothetical protein EPO07_17505, partial [Verrucomicrobia bacterium]